MYKGNILERIKFHELRSENKELTRMVEVSVFAILEPIRHKEQVFIVVRVARKLNDRSRVGESGEIVEPVTSTSLFRASLEAEKIKDVYWSRDLPLMLQK